MVLPAFMGLGFPNINGAYGFHSIDGPMVLTALMDLWFSQLGMGTDEAVVILSL